ncbi:MAG TPA: MFS transporter [Solirubrobacterales bacterium]
MRRLLILASTLVFFDVAFYAAIAPLLPDYAAEFGLSEAQAGILAAAYAAGTLIASLPAGLLATKIGPRLTVIWGLMLLGISSVVFGFGAQIAVLDIARFAQGISGAMVWSGALTWLITSAPAEQRGSVIGTAVGTAVAGALVGPLLGGIAAEVGTEVIFSAVLGVAAVLAVFAARTPEARVPAAQAAGEVVATMLSRPILLATWFVAVPSLMFGAVEVLVPLRIDELGGGHALIAGGFIVGAGIEASLAPIAGRYSDRVGRRAPFVTGVAIGAVAMLGIALAQALGTVLAALIVTSVGAGFSFSPAMTSLSERAEASGLHQGFAAGLTNVAWSAGQVVGAVAGGGLATAAGFAVPNIAVAVLMALTALYAFRVLAPPAIRPAEG